MPYFLSQLHMFITCRNHWNILKPVMVGNMEFYNTVLYMKVNIFICTTNINKTSVCSKNSSNCIVYSENEFSIKCKFKEVLTQFYSKVLYKMGQYF